MSKVINLAERRAERDHQNHPMPGFIIWLHCPNCKTTEYTELKIEGGRIHNKCGALVEEKFIPIDIRAEYTITVKNIEILRELAKKSDVPKFLGRLLGPAKQMLQQMEEAEWEFQKRLKLIAPNGLTPYSENWDPNSYGVDAKVIQPFGIMYSAARQPDIHFPCKNR